MPALSARTAPVLRHEVQFYGDDGFLAQEVGRFIGEALRDGRAAIVVATAAHREAIATQLRRDGLDLELALEDEQARFLDAEETLARFMVDGLPDRARFHASVGELVHASLSARAGVAAYGEMVDVLTAQGNAAGTQALERLWTDLLTDLPAHLLCGYRLDRFDRDADTVSFRHVCTAHTHVRPTEQYAALDLDADQRRRIAELEQRALALESEVHARVEAERALLRSQGALKVKAEELARSNDELQRFAYVCAHDLKEPLRMITQYMSLVKHRCANHLDSDLRTYVDYAVTGAERMRELIDSLLAYGQLGHEGIVIEDVNLSSQLVDVHAVIEPLVREAGAEIRYESLPTVRADGLKLRQVFQNLIVNALKYRSPRPPRIVVSGKDGGDHWLLSVADNGLGIDAAHHERIFQVFRRLHTNATHTGTGIGLAICRRIVEQHGGRIWVESTEGEGSTFHFTLPKQPPNLN